MLIKIPTFEALFSRVAASIRARLPNADLSLRWSMTRILATVQTQLALILYERIDSLARQITPLEATGPWLAGWSILRGVPRRGDGPASGIVEISGRAGLSVPTGALLRRADGVTYRVVTGRLIPGASPNLGLVQVEVVAVDNGAGANADPGTRLLLSPALPDILPDATVVADDLGLGLTGGVDVEPEESWRDRVIDAWRQPPQGGAAHDYVRWAMEVPGVSRAWVLPHWLGLGTVGLLVAWQDGVGERAPSDLELRRVWDWIDHGRAGLDPPQPCRPVTAILVVLPIRSVGVTYQIHIDPDTPEVRAAIAENLRLLHRRRAAPGGKLLISQIREQISVAAGEADNAVIAITGPDLIFDSWGNVSAADATAVLAVGTIEFSAFPA